MLYLLVVLVVILWIWVFIKTWSYVVNNLDNRGGRASVVFGFFSGLLWPFTYVLLSGLLLLSVLIGCSVEESIYTLKKQWNRNGN